MPGMISPFSLFGRENLGDAKTASDELPERVVQEALVRLGSTPVDANHAPTIDGLPAVAVETSISDEETIDEVEQDEIQISVSQAVDLRHPLYKKYDLTKEEIAFIESKIRPMGDENNE